MAAVSSTMKERTTGTVSTKGKTILPEWATWGVLPHGCNRRELLFIQRPAELEVRRHRTSRSEGRPRPRPAHQQGTGTSEGDL